MTSDLYLLFDTLDSVRPSGTYGGYFRLIRIGWPQFPENAMDRLRWTP